MYCFASSTWSWPRRYIHIVRVVLNVQNSNFVFTSIVLFHFSLEFSSTFAIHVQVTMNRFNFVNLIQFNSIQFFRIIPFRSINRTYEFVNFNFNNFFALWLLVADTKQNTNDDICVRYLGLLDFVVVVVIWEEFAKLNFPSIEIDGLNWILRKMN